MPSFPLVPAFMGMTGNLAYHSHYFLAIVALSGTKSTTPWDDGYSATVD